MLLSEIQERCSVRNFIEKPVPNKIIENILEAGRLAPSWMNIQSWHFVVVKDIETKKLLSELSHGQPHLIKADTIIVCCGNKKEWEYKVYKEFIKARPGITQEKIDKFLNSTTFTPDLKGEEAVKIRCVEQVTYATAYMTLEAHKNGVGCCIIGAIGNELTDSVPETYKKLKEKLNLPPELMVITLLPIGYTETKCTKKIRKPKEQVVSYERFGE